jgi:hypothetical protein
VYGAETSGIAFRLLTGVVTATRLGQKLTAQGETQKPKAFFSIHGKRCMPAMINLFPM